MSVSTDGVERKAGRFSVAESGLLIASVAYLLALSIYLSSRRMMWLDEFFAWGVLTDPSLKHAMHAWLEGADSGGALYYILGHTLLAMTGPSVLAARLFGAVLLAGAFVLWFLGLRRVFDVPIALLASFVLLLSAGTLNYLAEVRFYPLLILAVVASVWLGLWAQREDHSRWLLFVLFFLVHGALVSSHLLGIVYSAMVLLGMIVCANPGRYIAPAAGIVTSWSLLLFARQPIHVGGMRVAGMHLAPPHWDDLFTVYLSEPSLPHRLNLILYLWLVITAVQWSFYKRRGWPLRDDPRSLLFRVSALLSAVPALFFAESWVGPWPLWVVRYMLPGILGISCLTGFALEYQSRQAWVLRLSRTVKTGIYAVLLLAIVALHVDAVTHQILRPRFTEAQLKPIERGLPVVVANEELFFQLKFYEPNAVPQFYYIHVHLPTATAVGERADLMRTIERQGYWGGSLRTQDEFLEEVGDFLMLESQQRDAALIEELQRKGWVVTSLGTEELDQRHVSILRFKRPNV